MYLKSIFLKIILIFSTCSSGLLTSESRLKALLGHPHLAHEHTQSAVHALLAHPPASSSPTADSGT